MRIRCQKCGKIVALIAPGWRRRLSAVMVCGRCYDELLASHVELNQKDADYAGAPNDTVETLKNLFGMKG
jgi:DNA-directed RNA polymerase subunit N (RpoN/RPB10)